MNEGWTISIDATSDAGVTDDEIAQLLELLRPQRGVLAIGPEGRLGATVSIDANAKVRTITDATARGVELLLRAIRHGLGRGGDFTIVRVDACTYAEHDAELERPVYPELVGVRELAELFDVSPQRASDLRSRAGFPAPVAELKSGPVWVKANVEHFAATWTRKVGRPRKAAS